MHAMVRMFGLLSLFVFVTLTSSIPGGIASSSAAPSRTRQPKLTVSLAPRVVAWTITGVSFTGGVDAPTITIYGSGFGSAPSPATVSPCGHTGTDYYSQQLSLSDFNPAHQFSAGQDIPGRTPACIGLINLTYSDAQISFQFGSTYTRNPSLFKLAQGDPYAVFIQGARCDGTVDYTATSPQPCTRPGTPSATAMPTSISAQPSPTAAMNITRRTARPTATTPLAANTPVAKPDATPLPLIVLMLSSSRLIQYRASTLRAHLSHPINNGNIVFEIRTASALTPIGSCVPHSGACSILWSRRIVGTVTVVATWLGAPQSASVSATLHVYVQPTLAIEYAVWQKGPKLALTRLGIPLTRRSFRDARAIGHLDAFKTTDPTIACYNHRRLSVFSVPREFRDDYLVAAAQLGRCPTMTWLLPRSISLGHLSRSSARAGDAINIFGLFLQSPPSIANVVFTSFVDRASVAVPPMSWQSTVIAVHVPPVSRVGVVTIAVDWYDPLTDSTTASRTPLAIRVTSLHLPTVLNPRTMILPPSALSGLVLVSGQVLRNDQASLTLVFRRPSSRIISLSPGAIIDVGPSTFAPEGLLRRVIAVRHLNSLLLIDTVAATLIDAIEQGTLDVQQTLSASSINPASVHSLTKGISAHLGAPVVSPLLPDKPGVHAPRFAASETACRFPITLSSDLGLALDGQVNEKESPLALNFPTEGIKPFPGGSLNWKGTLKDERKQTLCLDPTVHTTINMMQTGILSGLVQSTVHIVGRQSYNDENNVSASGGGGGELDLVSITTKPKLVEVGPVVFSSQFIFVLALGFDGSVQAVKWGFNVSETMHVDATETCTSLFGVTPLLLAPYTNTSCGTPHVLGQPPIPHLAPGKLTWGQESTINVWGGLDYIILVDGRAVPTPDVFFQWVERVTNKDQPSTIYALLKGGPRIVVSLKYELPIPEWVTEHLPKGLAEAISFNLEWQISVLPDDWISLQQTWYATPGSAPTATPTLPLVPVVPATPTAVAVVPATPTAVAVVPATPTSTSFETVMSIADGGTHSLAVHANGQVFAWGYDDFGDLGNGPFTQTVGAYENETPQSVQGLPSGDPITAVASGYYHSLALSASGRVYAWGSNGAGQLGIRGGSSPRPIPVQGLPADDPVSAIAASGDSSAALTRAGHVYLWGVGSASNYATTTTANYTPTLILGLPQGDPAISMAIDALGEDVIATHSGLVYLWHGLVASASSPFIQPVHGLPVDDPVVSVAGARLSNYPSHAYEGVALTKSGRVYGFDFNGAASSTTIQGLPADDPVKAIMGSLTDSNESDSALAVTRSGRVYAWGNFSTTSGLVITGSDGSRQLQPVQMGPIDNANTYISTSAVPVQGLPTGDPIVAIATSPYQSMAMTQSGQVITWGQRQHLEPGCTLEMDFDCPT